MQLKGRKEKEPMDIVNTSEVSSIQSKVEMRDEQALGKERVKLIKKKKKKLRNHYQKIQKSGHLLKSEKVRIQKGYMGWGYFLIRMLTK